MTFDTTFRAAALALACLVLAAPAPAAATPIDDGPGGPILVIAGDTNAFGGYFAEILRNEGLNAFDVDDLSAVTPATLAAHDVAILGETPLTAPQVTMLSDWVQAGGNLIAMRPDPQLAGLLDLTAGAGTLSNAYLKVDTSTAPGAGIAGATMQFHGVADQYGLAGATPVATLYSDAATATPHPAVTLTDVGSNGGQAAAFAFDLAKSVVYTRQGNPAYVGQERDGFSPIRSDDLFYPDWIDLDKVAIPQADEQQRLLANLIAEMNADQSPLPRFWYLPRGEKAAVVMTGDDHGSGNVGGRLDAYAAASPAGCDVGDWECVRATAYVYPGTTLSDAQAAAYEAAGFEIGAHVNTNCSDYTPAQLETYFSSQLAAFALQFPSLPPQVTNRTHCIAWGGWVDQPQVEAAHGVRLDTNYYYWPPSWIQDRPGMFTGSGLPMRFADLDGSMLDVYQATTQLTDESGQTYPFTIDALLDKALGPEGYYGVFTANMHTDSASSPAADAIVSSALSEGVPVVSARQMLTWLDGRNDSTFGSIAFAGDTLSFTVAPAGGANGLTTMVPTESEAGTLTEIERDGTPVSFTTQTIKGVEYAFVDAVAGAYAATYAPAPPASSTFTDTTSADFGLGTGDTYVSGTGGGALTLTPAVAAEFGGTALPADWTSGTWESEGGGAGGTATVDGGSLTVNGAWAATTATFAPGHALDFEATFGGATHQHAGLGVDLNTSANWAMFSTNGTTNQLWARTNAAGTTINTPLSVSLVGPHRFRVVWNPSTVEFYVDGALVATHNATITAAMRPIASDFTAGGPSVSVDWLRMSPYASDGTFTSRVFDAGTAVDWGALDFDADSGATISVRTGDTPAPDGTWSAFVPLASGDAIAAQTRYLQYRAVLTTGDPLTTPLVREVSVAYASSDTTAPVTQIDDGPTGTITVDTAEFTFSADESGSTFECRLDAGAWAACTSPKAYTGLTDGSHTFAVRATDLAGNTDQTAVTRTFTVALPVLPSEFVDTTTAEFGLGTGDTYVSGTGGGALTLAPAVAAEFDGSALPGDWTGGTWDGVVGGLPGTTTVAGGSLALDGAWAGTAATYTPGRALDFEATFGSAAFQHVGFGVDFNSSENWAMFSTNNTSNQLWARTNAAGIKIDTPLPGTLVGLPHRYRVVWNASTVEFYVDGALVATHNATITAAMRPLASDLNTGGPGVSVDWLRMSPYAADGTFTSRVFDAGSAVDWDALTFDADSGVTISVRTGDSPAPDGTWSAFVPLASGAAIPTQTRYLQYRAVLTTGDPLTTPLVREVKVTYADADTTAPDTQIDTGPDDTITVDHAEFTFSSNESGSTFECRLDGGDWEPCTSPQSLTGLDDGGHTFAVRATDAAGNTDQTPATGDFTVALPDTSAPDTQIDSGPTGTITVATAQFEFSADETGSTFECRLDGGAWTACTSPKAYSGLANGSHTFAVRATDAAANTDQTPATRSFTVALPSAPGPEITIDRPWQGARYSHYSIDKPAHRALYSCAAAVTCTAEVDGQSVASGAPFPRPNPSPAASVAQTFEVTATDTNGNTSTKSVTYRVYTFESLIEDLSPIAYWRLNDGVGADAMHATAGPDGEYKNGQDSEPWGISGDGDASRFFTGADGYAYVNGITAPRRYTLSAFVNFAEDDRTAMVMQHGGAGAVWYDGDRLHFRPVDWDAVELTSPAIGANKWHHVAATFGSGTARLYLDGELVDSAFSAKQTSGTSTFYLAYGDKAPWLQGGLDEAAYFDTALNVDQVHQIWLADPPPAKPAATSAQPAPASPEPAAAAQPAATKVPATTTVQSIGIASKPAVPVTGVRVRKGVLTAKVSVAGTVRVTVRFRGKRVVVATRRVARAGRVTIRLSKAAKRKIAAAPRTVKVTVRG